MKLDFLLKINGKEDKDLTQRLCSVLISDESGSFDDELNLSFALDKKLVLVVVPPKLADEISLAIGPKDELITWESYSISEIEADLSCLKVRAYACDSIPALREKRDRVWNTTIGHIVAEIAGKSQVGYEIDSALSNKKVKLIQNESDLSFLHNLAKNHNVILKFTNKKICLVSDKQDGNHVKISDLSSWSWKKTKHATSVKALYWDKKTKLRKSIIIGEGEHPASVSGVFSNEEKAIAKAQSFLIEQKKFNECLKISLPCTDRLNTAKIACGAILDISCLENFADGLWLVKKAEHSLSSEGLTSTFECVRGDK